MRSSIILLLFSIFRFVSAQPYSDYVGAGHTDDIVVSSSSSAANQESENTINNVSTIDPLYDASRFLSQATLGADYELIQQVHQKGFEVWLNEEFEKEYAAEFQSKTWEIWDWFYPQYIALWG